jgi:hypothetical protein
MSRARRKRGSAAERDRSLPRAASSLVEQVLRQHGAHAAVREHRLVTGWIDIVGERVAQRAWPSGLQKGVLWVRVVNSAWMQELSFLREAIARAAADYLGPPPIVKEVRLHLPGKGEPQSDAEDVVAALARRKRPPKKSAPPAPPPVARETLVRIDAETSSVKDDELRETIRTLRKKLGM